MMLVCVWTAVSGEQQIAQHSQRILTGNTAQISGSNASYWIIKCAKERQTTSAESYSGENGIVFMQACCVELYQLIYLYKQHYWESTVKDFIVSCNKTSFFLLFFFFYFMLHLLLICQGKHRVSRSL